MNILDETRQKQIGFLMFMAQAGIESAEAARRLQEPDARARSIAYAESALTQLRHLLRLSGLSADDEAPIREKAHQLANALMRAQDAPRPSLRLEL